MLRISNRPGLTRRLATILFITVMTIVSGNLVGSGISNLIKAQEVQIPAHLTALEYIDQLKAADANEDGIINLIDYITLEEDYYKEIPYSAADTNVDGRVNSLDASFILSNLALDPYETESQILKDPKLAAVISKEIAVKNETGFPPPEPEFVGSTLTMDNALSINGGGGGGQEQGRNVIPSVLGTVSEYIGSANFLYPMVLPEGPGGFRPTIGISYSSANVDDARNNGSHDGKPFYKDASNYRPSMVGYGFSLNGIGSIMRDTMGEKDVYRLKNDMHHRYILSLPGGISAQLKFNTSTGRWASIPQSFLKIDHAPAGRTLQAGGNLFLDGGDWIITTKDGTKYYFGEEDIAAKVESNGRINDSANKNLYIEYDTAHLCKGESEKNPCDAREENGKVLITTKWLLRKIESPDGKIINYTYDTHQRKLDEKFDSNIEYVTTTAYPKEISWNEDKHRVTFDMEENDRKGPDDYMKNRIKAVRVLTRLQSDNQFHLVKKYALSYYEKNTDTKENLGIKAGDHNEEGIDNSWKAAFLTSIQEFGADETSSMPLISFRYIQYSFPPQGYHGGEIYLYEINNGLGGSTKYAYQMFKTPILTPHGNFQGEVRRARVVEKRVVDNTSQGRSYWSTYDYGRSRAYAPRFRDGNNGAGASGTQFLGHSSSEMRSYDFDGTQIDRTRNEYHQVAESDGCINPHPAKGSASKEISYSGDEIVSVRRPVYQFRLAGEVDENATKCSHERIEQPYFSYVRDMFSEFTEPGDVNFVPAEILSKISISPQKKKMILQRNLEYDIYGNLTKSVSYQDVDENGYDIDESDNKYSFSYYLTDGAAWIKGLPYLQYQSNSERCGADDMSCQWGRIRTFYDNFDKDYRELSWDDQQPKYGYVSQEESYIDNNKMMLRGTEYHRYSDGKIGGVTKQYAPKRNVETATSEDIILVSETKYDSYYNTLATESKNLKGQKILKEDYDYLLQVAKTVRAQINESPERYARTEMAFDPLGRLVRSYMSDPDDPDSVIPYPNSLIHLFEKGNDGLVVRKATLSSITPDGKYNYVIADTHYDGMGNVKQSQVLSSKVDGVLRRKITETKLFSDGLVDEEYEIQTADPILVGDIRPDNVETVLANPQPNLVTIPKQLIAKHSYDALRREIELVQIEPVSGERHSMKSGFATNGSFMQDSKGGQFISLSDGSGREKYSLNSDNTGNKWIIREATYGQTMIDLPTRTTITDGSKTVAMENTYDRGGRLLTVKDPSHGDQGYKYDIYDSVILESSQPRNEIAYEYDDMGRLIKKQYTNWSNGDMYKKLKKNVVEYKYDAGENAVGQVVLIEDATGKEELFYDGGQRVVKIKKTIFDKSQAFETVFNKLSQKTKSILPDTTLEYEYDGENNLQSMSVNGEKHFAGALYDKFGTKTGSSVNFGGDQYTVSGTHDVLGRTTSLNVRDSDSEIIAQGLFYDGSGKLDRLIDRSNGQNVTFRYQYDNYSQLAGVSSGIFNTTYSYDNFGRITNKSEKQEVELTYDESFPFFAPKSVVINYHDVPQPSPTTTPSPITYPSREPTYVPLPTITITRAPTLIQIITPTPTRQPTITSTPTQRPTATSMPTQRPTTTPTPTQRPTATPIPSIHGCSYYAKAYVRECTNAECTQWRSLGVFDKDERYGLANEYQRDTRGDGPVETFGSTPGAGPGEHIYQTPNFKPPSEQKYRSQSIKIYIDESRWEIVKRQSVGPGGPTQEQIDSVRDKRYIGDFSVNCGTNVTYGWYVKEKGMQFSALNLGSDAFDLQYTPKGSLKGDHEACYFYNRDNKLYWLKVKTNPLDSCSTSMNSLKDLYFYYDHGGKMVLQEEYLPGDADKPIKQHYMFGSYEEIYVKE